MPCDIGHVTCDYLKIGFSSALSIQPSFTDSQLEFAKTIRPRVQTEIEPIYMKSLGTRQKSNDMQSVHLDSLISILEELCNSYKKQGPTNKMLEDCQHPASSATYWISKWVDYSDKFGFGKSSQNNWIYPNLLISKVTLSAIIRLESNSTIWVIFCYMLMVKKFNTLTKTFEKLFALLEIIRQHSRKGYQQLIIAESIWKRILLKLDLQRFEIVAMIFLDCQFCKDGSKQDVPFACGFQMDACK